MNERKQGLDNDHLNLLKIIESRQPISVADLSKLLSGKKDTVKNLYELQARKLIYITNSDKSEVCTVKRYSKAAGWKVVTYPNQTAHGLTGKQRDLLKDVAQYGPINTHELAEKLGHRQAYETDLRDRLFRLARRGLVTYAERLYPRLQRDGSVVSYECRERMWKAIPERKI